MRVAGAVMWTPELPAMNAVPQKSIMHRHDADTRMPARGPAQRFVVRPVDAEHFRPGRQPGRLGISPTIGGVVDVSNENPATAGEPDFQQAEHFLQPLFVRGDPWHSLLERGAVHRSFARGRLPIPVDEVIA